MSSDPGVQGTSPLGVGVSGVGRLGGAFESTSNIAQLRLVPEKATQTIELGSINTVTILLKDPSGVLPAKGEAGDLFCVTAQVVAVPGAPRFETGSPWFCEVGSDASNSAQWRQVLMGPSFPGKRP